MTLPRAYQLICNGVWREPWYDSVADYHDAARSLATMSGKPVGVWDDTLRAYVAVYRPDGTWCLAG